MKPYPWVSSSQNNRQLSPGVCTHDHTITWKHFLHYWISKRGIHWSLMASHHKGLADWSSDISFAVNPNKLLHKQQSYQWFEPAQHSCDITVIKQTSVIQSHYNMANYLPTTHNRYPISNSHYSLPMRVRWGESAVRTTYNSCCKGATYCEFSVSSNFDLWSIFIIIILYGIISMA